MQGPSPSPASQFGTRAWFRPRCYTAHVLLATCVAFPTGKYTTKEGFTYTSRNFMLTYTSRNVIYTIICKWWNMKYIGDAGRHLADRPTNPWYPLPYCPTGAHPFQHQWSLWIFWHPIRSCSFDTSENVGAPPGLLDGLPITTRTEHPSQLNVNIGVFLPWSLVHLSPQLGGGGGRRYWTPEETNVYNVSVSCISDNFIHVISQNATVFTCRQQNMRVPISLRKHIMRCLCPLLKNCSGR